MKNTRMIMDTVSIIILKGIQEKTQASDKKGKRRKLRAVMQSVLPPYRRKGTTKRKERSWAIEKSGRRKKVTDKKAADKDVGGAERGAAKTERQKEDARGAKGAHARASDTRNPKREGKSRPRERKKKRRAKRRGEKKSEKHGKTGVKDSK